MSAKRNSHADHEAERHMRVAAAAEVRLLAEAAAAEQASRDRRRAAREAQRRAQAELEAELRTPLIRRRS